MLFALSACSDGSTPTAPAAPLCTGPNDASYECMGCAPSGRTWADGGSLPCPLSIADYCSPSAPLSPLAAPECPPAAWSAVALSASTDGVPKILESCNAMNLAWADWACGDAGVVYEYDKTTGKVLSALEISGPVETCLAGDVASVAYLDVTAMQCSDVSCASDEAGTVACASTACAPDADATTDACAAVPTGDL